MTSTVITTGRPLRVGTRRGAGGRRCDPRRRHRHPVVAGRRRSPAASRVIGVLGLESRRGARVQRRRRAPPRARSASSMGVALENARLFDETKRLLTETDERAAELAIINEVQQGLAAQIEMQAMYDLVGERLREVFDAQVARHRDLRPRDGAHPLPVHDRARRPVPGRADSAHGHPQARDRDPRAAADQRAGLGAGRSSSDSRARSRARSRSRRRGRRCSSAARRPASSRSRTSTASTRSPTPTFAS